MSLATAFRSLFATATGNWASRAYLALVAVLLVWAYADMAFVAQADSSFAGIYPIATSAPVSVALLAVHTVSAPVYPVFVVACALLNAWLIGLAVRRIKAHH
ncbi:SCO4225 family membrane protein [Streptomyces sp. NPDC058947]|uniref:SCO4225 family membrane protein n=1 Tax=Streptomyces sp. NPDC058947 TaxID=3346675 RepID=UPI0036A67ADB